jgi:hypothetical protein
VTYTENKNSTNYAESWRKKFKNAIKKSSKLHLPISLERKYACRITVSHSWNPRVWDSTVQIPLLNTIYGLLGTMNCMCLFLQLGSFKDHGSHI